MNVLHRSLSLVLLAFLVCSLVSFGATPVATRQVATAAVTTSGVLAPGPEPPAPELPHRILPLSILVYTEYADVAVGQEFSHAMAAINDTYGTDYYYTSLTSYANLGSALPNHDILLIPEQENANSTVMKTIGTAWASTLIQFVTDGGIVILMDFIGSDLAPTIHIYNASGLMKVYAPVSDYSWGLPVNLVNSSDALARGVAASWTSPDGTLTFGAAAADGTVVVASGINPVVTHKILGKGHVVLLGYDLYNREANADQLLGNAIRLHRHVVFDDSHDQHSSIFTGHDLYADALVAQDFAVSSMGSFSAAYLAACEVLVIPYCATNYTATEKTAIQSFVSEGGGLFVMGDWGTWGISTGGVAALFGYTLVANGSRLADTNENDPPVNDPQQPVYGAGNILNHSVSLGVTAVQMFYGTGIVGMPTSAVSILVTDKDGTAMWGPAMTARADAIPCYAASIFGWGRVVVSGDSNFAEDTDWDSDGTTDYSERSNGVLAVNTIRWLSAAGLKERIVLIDQSHSPLHTIGGNWLDFGNYLTCNGYTLHWMSTFYTNLVQSAHALVICQGGAAYTPTQITAITDFVNAGGGLVLVGDWGSSNQYTDPIGNEFDLDMASTANSYLSDSDDGSLAGNSYIVYERAEGNIGTSSITQGVNRIELDRSGGFNRIGAAFALVTTDFDGTCSWANGTVIVGMPVPVFAATTYSFIRVAYLSDVEFFSNSDPDADGETTFFDSDNNLFTVNLFQWLVLNRAPAVTVTAPNGGETLTGNVGITWTAVDYDKDSLTFDVLYSANSGGTWTPIATDLAGTSTSWDTAGLADGTQFLIRVVAHDYELSEQDASDATFTVDNHGPTISSVTLVPASPAHGEVILVSAHVTDVSGVLSVYLNYSFDGGHVWQLEVMAPSGADQYVCAFGSFGLGNVVQYSIGATDDSPWHYGTISSMYSFTVGIPLLWIILIVAAILVIVLVITLVVVLLRRRKAPK